MKKLFLTIVSLVFFAMYGMAQDCYSDNRSKGVSAYNSGKYAEAKKYFLSAQNCDMKPKQNDIATWIDNCNKKIHEQKQVHVFYLETSVSSVTDDGTGGSITINVKTNAPYWDYEYLPSWCSILNKTATSFELRVFSNQTASSRTGGFNIKTSDGSVFKRISVVQASTVAKASVEKIWVDHNYNNGMQIHVNFTVDNMLQKEGNVVAHFYGGEKALKDFNNAYCTHLGDVCCSRSYTPLYKSTKYNDFILYMPNDELHVKQNRKDLRFKIYIYDYDWNVIGASDYYNFNYYPCGIGTLNGEFSVSSTKKVRFSQGNLQYQANTGTWRFSEHQYDVIGGANKNISSNYSGWIDMFGWGTSGWNSGAIAYKPYSTSTNEKDYCVGGVPSNNITGNNANADWGVFNAISNGGNKTKTWRTLTYHEWKYLIDLRNNASNKCGLACVNGVNGLVLLPDSWTLPSGLSFISGAVGNYSQNIYSVAQWEKMEANGAVFLPAGGDRTGIIPEGVGEYGDYWSSTPYDGTLIYGLSFYANKIYMSLNERFEGNLVRLVKDGK